MPKVKCPDCGGTLHGPICKLCEMFQAAEVPGGHEPGCWPQTMIALACTPGQVQQANDRAKRHGIAAYYHRDGKVTVADRKARKQLIRLEGMHDNQGGYGD